MKSILTFLFLLYSITFFGQNANDCTDAIVLCGNTPVGVEPSGIGFDEFSLPGNFAPPCYSFNNQTAWFKVVIDQSGSFGFDIIPDNAQADYDFAVFGPVTDCQNLGNAIRCSSTNPQAANVSANTGLNSTEVDLSEGPGPLGNGYLKEIDAVAGETYYILIDRAKGNSGFQINVTGTSSLPQEPDFNEPSNLEACDDSGSHTFNLADQTPVITNGFPDSRVTYHASLGDANVNQNPLPALYTSTQAKETIYARVASNSGPCTAITTFDLIINSSPTYFNPQELFICNASTLQTYDLEPVADAITQNQPNNEVSFYRSAVELFRNQNPIDQVDVPLTGIEIFFNVRNTVTGCVIADRFTISYNNGPPLLQPQPIFVCRDGASTINTDFSTVEAEILNGLNPDAYNTYFYATPTDREQDIDRLDLQWENTAVSKTVYLRSINKTTGCYTDRDQEIIVGDNPEYLFPEQQYLCIDTPDVLRLEVDPSFAFYEWSTGENGPNTSQIEVTEPGTYSVTVYNQLGCSTTKTTVVSPSEAAQIVRIEITGLNYPRNEATLTVEGTGNYVFSLDGRPYQENTTFTGLSRGYHTLAVQDLNGCGIITSAPFLILDYPRYFTPNGDGYNDTWQLIGLDEYPGAELYILNRYGKLIKQITSNSKGWDGTYLGSRLQPDDFWFKLVLPEGIEVKGHFSLIY